MDHFNQFFLSFINKIGEVMPGITGAIIVLIIGYLFALGVKKLVLMLFKQTTLDERINSKLGDGFQLNHFIAKVAYYMVLIYVLLLVLGMMGIDQVLAPVSDMLSEFLSFLPNMLAAIIIGVAGYVIAKLASEAVGFLTASLQSFSEKAGLKGNISLAKILKQVVFILVFFPVLITAIDALNMKTISEPATQMFSDFLSAIPNIIAAALILAVFYIGGKYITTILVELLKNLGLDQFADSIGLSRFSNGQTLSNIIGNIAFFFLMFGGIIAAVEKLELTQVTDILNNIFEMSGKIFMGVVLLFIGNYLADLAKNALSNKAQNTWLGNLVKFTVLGLFIALGLHTMGIAQDIVNLAFGLIIGAVAVAFALSFGLGGREAAGIYTHRLLNKLDDKNIYPDQKDILSRRD